MNPIRRPRRARLASWCAAALLAAAPLAQAGLFDDDEARKAILTLRERISALEAQVQQQQAEARATQPQQAEQLSAMRRSVLELNNQLELMRAEVARLRGQAEQAQRELAELQRLQKESNQAFDDRLRKLEPQRVTVDGVEFVADVAEKRAYDDAIATLRSGDFDRAASALTTFLERHPNSGFKLSARFWLGNALYAKRDYKGAIAAFRSVATDAPEHPKAPEALLALANCQAETKDTKGARKTLEDLLKRYPASEAAAAAKDRPCAKPHPHPPAPDACMARTCRAVAPERAGPPLSRMSVPCRTSTSFP